MPKLISTKDFTNKSIKIHGDLYDYSLVKYENWNKKVKIICDKHGIFEQTPTNHTSRKAGCPKCFGNKKLTIEEFVLKSSDRHNNSMIYCIDKYSNNKQKIDIKCLNCGNIFNQEINNNLNGCGCPKCNISKGEKEIRQYLKNNNIIFEEQKMFEDLKDKSYLKFDFYLTNSNMCVEYDGIQHFEPREKFGGVKEYKKVMKRDKIKNEYCIDNNIRLIRIPYTKFKKIEKILEKVLNI